MRSFRFQWNYIEAIVKKLFRKDCLNFAASSAVYHLMGLALHLSEQIGPTLNFQVINLKVMTMFYQKEFIQIIFFFAILHDIIESCS